MNEMSGLEITNLILSILSLISSIAISLVIFFVQRKQEKINRTREIETEARFFLQNNAEERGYLPWATIATGCYPQNKHVRKIYNDFSLLDDSVKLKVLQMSGLENVELIKDGKWIDERLKLIRDSMKEMKLGKDYLYDGYKYFYRAYESYKENDFIKMVREDHAAILYEDVFKFGRVFLKVKGKLDYHQYLDDYLYAKYEDENHMPNECIKPNDYLDQMEHLSTCDEDEMCYWIMAEVKDALRYAIKYLGYDQREHDYTDSFPETYEDMYFSILYEMYYLKDKKPQKEEK